MIQKDLDGVVLLRLSTAFSVLMVLFWLLLGLGSFLWCCHLFADNLAGVAGLFAFMFLERIINHCTGVAVGKFKRISRAYKTVAERQGGVG